MTVLVTGGAGYIGSHVVKILGQAQEDLIIADNLSTGFRAAVLYGKFYHVDLADLEKLEKIFQDHAIESILHFAGSIVVPDSMKNPLAYYQNNTINAFQLLQLAVKYKVKNFIFSSTASLYGESASGECSESSPVNPINPYARSKFMFEGMLQDVCAAHNINSIILRYFNVAGADPDGQLGQSFPQATHLIKVACEVLTGKRSTLEVFGSDYSTPDGTCIRDYIHVTDLAQAHADALRQLRQQKKKYFEIFNCGYGQGLSVLEVLTQLQKVTGLKLQFYMAPRRAGDSAKIISKSEKIFQHLAWKPQFHNLEIIIKTAYQWELHRKY
jgi:UDP-glucose 4-epimerase